MEELKLDETNASSSYLAAGEEKIEEISLFSNGREDLFGRMFVKGLLK